MLANLTQHPKSRLRRLTSLPAESGKVTKALQFRRSSSASFPHSPIASGRLCKDLHLCKENSSSSCHFPIDAGRLFNVTHFAKDAPTNSLHPPMLSGKFVTDLQSRICQSFSFFRFLIESRRPSRRLHLSSTSSSKFSSSPIVFGSAVRDLFATPEGPPKISLFQL